MSKWYVLYILLLVIGFIEGLCTALVATDVFSDAVGETQEIRAVVRDPFLLGASVVFPFLGPFILGSVMRIFARRHGEYWQIVLLKCGLKVMLALMVGTFLGSIGAAIRGVGAGWPAVTFTGMSCISFGVGMWAGGLFRIYTIDHLPESSQESETT